MLEYPATFAENSGMSMMVEQAVDVTGGDIDRAATIIAGLLSQIEDAPPPPSDHPPTFPNVMPEGAGGGL